MKTLKTLGFAALGAMLLLPASVLLAQPPDGPPEFSHEPGFGGGFPGKGDRLEFLADKLDLSEGQIAEIEALREDQRQEVESLMEKARAARHAVGDVMRSDAFDEETIRAAAQQAADIHVELTVVRARHHSELRSVLTPEQQEKAAQLRQGWKERSEHFRGRPGRGFGRGPGPGARQGPGRW